MWLSGACRGGEFVLGQLRFASSGRNDCDLGGFPDGDLSISPFLSWHIFETFLWPASRCADALGLYLMEKRRIGRICHYRRSGVGLAG